MARARRRKTRGSRYFDDFGGFGGYPPYVPVAERRKSAAAAAAAMKKKGRTIAPVEIQGRKIATTFWGKAWCDNLERYSDFESRLPRGRTYVRNGSVIDLQIGAGEVTALVQGSSLYTVSIRIQTVDSTRWRAIVRECSGKIDSVVELLAGKLSGNVMEVMTREKTGLFPAPAHIAMKCSCPDWATMCKHVAAVLYGVGARLDHRPELLFELRGANPGDLIAEVASGGIVRAGKGRAKEKVLEAADLSSVFGIDIDVEEPPRPAKPARGKKVTAAPAVPSKKPPARGKAPAVAGRSPRAGAAPASVPVGRSAARAGKISGG